MDLIFFFSFLLFAILMIFLVANHNNNPHSQDWRRSDSREALYMNSCMSFREMGDSPITKGPSHANTAFFMHFWIPYLSQMLLGAPRNVLIFFSIYVIVFGTVLFQMLQSKASQIYIIYLILRAFYFKIFLFVLCPGRC